MHDATSSSSDFPPPAPSVEHLQQENQQLKDKLNWYETEFRKLAKMISASNGRKETHLSSGGSPWLPFDSPKELEQAKHEAEADAQKLLDDLPNPPSGKPKKPKSSSLPAHLPQVKKLCDVSESERTCSLHGPMTMIGIDTTETLVYEPAKLYKLLTEYPKYGCACCKENGIISSERPTGLVEGNKYDSSVAAAVITQKYDAHLPLYRQTEAMEAQSTMRNHLTIVETWHKTKSLSMKSEDN